MCLSNTSLWDVCHILCLWTDVTEAIAKIFLFVTSKFVPVCSRNVSSAFQIKAMHCSGYRLIGITKRSTVVSIDYNFRIMQLKFMY
ncbi:hypothetical protein FKM82_018961 [Ascaphus truei]